MKKLMIAAAIALAGVASNAATMTWSTLNVQDSPDATASIGWQAMLFEAGTTFDYDALIKGELKPSYTSSAIAGTSAMPVKFQDAGLNKPDGKTAWASGDVASFYAVIFDASAAADAKNYIVSAVKSATVNQQGSNIMIAFGNMGGTSATTRGAWDGATWQSVPEPTSGLLLLLGVAGLALRRRRA